MVQLVDNVVARTLMATVFCLTGTTIHATDVLSCKLVGDGHVGSDASWGRALYGDSDFERGALSLTDAKTLLIDKGIAIKFGNDNFDRVGSSTWAKIYDGGYWGYIDLYDYREDEGKATLFGFRTNGFNSQKSNYVDVELWHCNR